MFVDPLRWFAKEPDVTARLLRFSSTFPGMDDEDEIVRLFNECLLPVKDRLPWVFKPLFAVGRHSPNLLKKLLSLGMELFSKRFIAGNGTCEIVNAVKGYMKKGYFVNLDILREEVLSECEVADVVSSYVDLVDVLYSVSSEAVSISVKPSSFYSQISPASPDHSAEKIYTALSPMVERISGYGGHIYLDAEGYMLHEVHFLVFRELYLRFGGSTVRFVLQTYWDKAHEILSWLFQINREGDPIWVRVVRGAYLEPTWYLAELMSWYSPVFYRKCDTDRNFDSVFSKGLSLGFKMVPATHNADTIMRVEQIAHGFGKEVEEYQLLYGIGEPYGEVLKKNRRKCRFYMPVVYPRKDRLVEAQPYLIRRISESQVSFVTQTARSDFRGVLRLLDRRLRDLQ